jgi:mannose-6-phosphate isomerase
MQKIVHLKNPIQQYAWGDTEAIARLLGDPTPSPKPQAELWLGAHPKAPSLVRTNGDWVALDKLIEADPRAILGENIAARFHNRLPYLFKVLAAAKPLSIQAHPNRHQAREGFQRENFRGIELNAPHRNYKDDNHKPECICALTPFWALCRFRHVTEIQKFLRILSPNHLASRLEGNDQRPDRLVLRDFFENLASMETTDKRRILEAALIKADKLKNEDPAYGWMVTLGRDHPDDIGILSPIMLNLIQLRPGQALCLPAGELHAYLKGVAIELMANSDNVLRGGLTCKHVDVPELLRVLTFRTGPMKVLTGEAISDLERVYRCPVEEFQLSVLTLKEPGTYTSSAVRSAEIILCGQGKANISDYESGDRIALNQGQSVLIPAAVRRYGLAGEGICYKAAVPDPP